MIGAAAGLAPLLALASLLAAGPMLAGGSGPSTPPAASRTTGTMTVRARTVRFDDGAASRGDPRDALTGGTGWESSDSDIDVGALTGLHASNPTIRALINGRDLNQTPAGWNPDHETGDRGDAYPYGQCTWWAYKRRAELGLPTGSNLGNGGMWADTAAAMGYWVDSTPRPGDAAVFAPGQYGADGWAGHVAVVEKVNDDHSILISEANVNGQVGPFQRTLPADQAKGLRYVHY